MNSFVFEAGLQHLLFSIFYEFQTFGMPGDVQTSGENDQICYIWVSGERSPLPYGFLFSVSRKQLKDGSKRPIQRLIQFWRLHVPAEFSSSLSQISPDLIMIRNKVLCHFWLIIIL